MNSELEKIFYEMFKDLPCKGPGDYNSTRRAYELVKPFVIKPLILDIGCGNGRQTLDLLDFSDAQITAVDNYKPFIDELNSAINTSGYNHRAKAETGDMFRLSYPDSSFDIIWSEGAIYIMGFEKGLLEFNRLIRPGGFIAVTEISWLQSRLSSEPNEYWSKVYPVMNSIEKNSKIINNCGYELIDFFTLPITSWTDNYYKYLSESLKKLKVKYAENKEALDLLRQEEYEMDLFGKYSDEYGYVFYIMRKPEQLQL